MSLNLKKRKNHNFMLPEKVSKLRYRAFIGYTAEVRGEFETGYVEVVSKKKKIVDKTPGFFP